MADGQVLTGDNFDSIVTFWCLPPFDYKALGGYLAAPWVTTPTDRKAPMLRFNRKIPEISMAGAYRTMRQDVADIDCATQNPASSHVFPGPGSKEAR
jgi:hypothetical protein